MQLPEARRVLGRFLAPLDPDTFLDSTLSGGVLRLARGDDAPWRDLLGDDPARLLAAASHLAPDLTWHSANPSGPPPSLAEVTGEDDFRARIDAFHARNYSVRFPNLRPLAAGVDAVARALETLLHQPVTVSAFWSRGGMRAPVHYDDHDLIVVQLVGTKRWYVSSEPSQLFNTWRGVSGNPPDLGPHQVFDMAPGDLVYLPRGTHHTVDSDTASIHVAIGFTPLTLRDALIAALDHLSDHDLAFRATVGGRLGDQIEASALDVLAPPVVEAAQRLLAAARTPGFVGAALQRRSARAIGQLEPLARPARTPAVTLDTPLRRAPGAFSHLTANQEAIDFAYPGGHLYLHWGSQAAVVFIADTPRFCARDLPGDLADDVRIALVQRFLAVGFLEIEPGAVTADVMQLFGSA